ncbi:MAG: GNAT family acetyltransferase [Lachnospiraceae bacterium]|nr:GNAT family acetyltransferase [Lachnospiraceae bacterium]
MIERKDFLALNFYKKSPFFGSCKNMHYRIARVEIGDKESGESEVVFKVTYWPGPYACDKTADTLKQEAQFPFSEEGLCQVADFLNEQYEKQKELWQLSTMR